MFIATIVLILIASVLLVLVVLAQNSKGGGISSQFGGSGASQMLGAQKTTDLLEKITWGLSSAIAVLVLFSNFFISSAPTDTNITSPNIDRAIERRGINQPSTPQSPAPGQATGTETEQPNSTPATGGEEENDDTGLAAPSSEE